MYWKRKLKNKRTLANVVAFIQSCGGVADLTNKTEHVSENEKYYNITEGKQWEIRTT